ncbi:Calcium-transporting ATPase [Hartmannibacter diazotrophicus]|uniref:Calcium-transporting ATPase n=1 Tax=Hartmannibacter diazotrophicus TaxID=1482074 RepID=A0A2C9D198_9HYPH|nr:cation-transporting P-type ATPase [Hartmannibacter diazotrophicus]SON53938.1 Calcium-transporting ATPase [Hartmannibacter diazotrophicus]
MRRRSGRGATVWLMESALSAATVICTALPSRLRLRDNRVRHRPDLGRTLGKRIGDAFPGLSVDVSDLTGSILIRGVEVPDADHLRNFVERVLDGALAPEGHGRSETGEPEPPIGHPHWPDGSDTPAAAPHAETLDRLVEEIGGDTVRGLDADDAAERIVRFGLNTLPKAEARSSAAIFAGQLTSLPVALLGASAALSFFTGGLADAAVILGVVLLNAGIGTVTERQAERTIAGLANYEPRNVRVVRGGAVMEIDPAHLAPGDLLLLEPGTLVPADARLVIAEALTVNESALTGEAMPVHKEAGVVLAPDIVLADRANMVFRGTAVTGGSGVALVVSTGSSTEIGRIQSLLGSLQPPPTPIERQLGEVEKELVVVNALISAAVFGIGLMRGHPLISILRSAISLAVAAIPEGLPAVAATTLAFGINDMRKRQIFVRKLDAVETLGAVEVIGLDKTGTLTGATMSLAEVHAAGSLIDMDCGRIAGSNDGTIAEDRQDVLRQLLETAMLVSEATVETDADGVRRIVGSATESALVEAALAHGIDLAGLKEAQPVVELAARADGRKRMSALCRSEDRLLLAVKGDPAEVLARSAHIRTATGTRPLTREDRDAVLAANEGMAGRALRVLGVASRDGGGDPRDEADLTWLGLVGIANPLRPNVRPVIGAMHGAGIRTVMITGDQSATAFAIAREVGLATGGDVRVFEAGRLAGMKPEVLAAVAGSPDVFARVSPTEKLGIVRALQSHGSVVAMTGDGINDGPALKAANIGIAMGADGTDVAREVADIVLATDDLEGIVEAIRLGRASYDNIRKVLRFLVSTNASETVVMLGATALGIAEPLSPMQLLMLNLLTDVFPALALGLEPPEENVLRRPPHDPKASILDVSDFRKIVREGLVIGGVALAGFLANGQAGGVRRGGTIAFHGLTLAQLLHAFSCRQTSTGLTAGWGAPANPALYAALAGCLGIQAGAQMLPATRRLLGLTPLGASGLAGALAIAAAATVGNRLLATIFDEPGPQAEGEGTWSTAT